VISNKFTYNFVHNIKDFLILRNWRLLSDNEKFFYLEPPLNLHFKENFKIKLPKKSDLQGYDEVVKEIITFVSKVYNINEEDLKIIFKSNNSIFSVKINDESVKDGTLPLVKFDDLLLKIKNILLNSAGFTILKDINILQLPQEANKYLSKCNFLQTEKGSFVTKIELPEKVLIRENTLFDAEVYSKEINKKILDVLNFVNDEVFGSNKEFNLEYLKNKEDVLNVKVLKEVYDLYDKGNFKNISFKLNGIENQNEINTFEVTPQKKLRLENLIESVNILLHKEGEFEFIGKIIMLKSKDPDGRTNKIILHGLTEGMEFFANVKLNKENYFKAIEAHKFKKEIYIKGLGKKSKKNILFTNLTQFTIRD
jgi:hypothetical protein